MKKYQRGFMSGIGDQMAQAFIVAMILFFIGGIIGTLFAIYAIPAIWDWVKPWLHMVTA